MEVLVAEYVCSSPSCLGSLRELVTEGYAMAYAAARTLAGAGASVSLALCREVLERVPPPSGVHVAVVPEGLDMIGFLREHADLYDYVLAIAPPPQLVEAAELLGSRLLGPSPELVEALSDKYSTARLLEELGVRVPRTLLVPGDGPPGGLGYPLVVKPVDGAGASGVLVVRSPGELEEAVEEARRAGESGGVVAQEFIPGLHVSLSMIVRDGELLLLSLNLQLVEVCGDGRVRYHGGLLPLRKGLEEASSIAYRLAKGLPGLRGYVGVDAVLSGSGLYVVEVNPRLTTSYTGLGKLLGPGLGELLLASVRRCAGVKRRVPLRPPEYSYYVLAPEGARRLSGEELIYVPGLSREALYVGVTRGWREASSRLRELLPGGLSGYLDQASSLSS